MNILAFTSLFFALTFSCEACPDSKQTTVHIRNYDGPIYVTPSSNCPGDCLLLHINENYPITNTDDDCDCVTKLSAFVPINNSPQNSGTCCNRKTSCNNCGISCNNCGTSGNDCGTSCNDYGTSCNNCGTPGKDCGISCNNCGTSGKDCGISCNNCGTSCNDCGTSFNKNNIGTTCVASTNYNNYGTGYNGRTVFNTGGVYRCYGTCCNDVRTLCNSDETSCNNIATNYNNLLCSNGPMYQNGALPAREPSVFTYEILKKPKTCPECGCPM